MDELRASQRATSVSQAVADRFYAVQGNAVPQQIQIDAAIGVAGKDKLACISALGNVMGYSDCDHPGQTRHASYLNNGIDFLSDSAERAPATQQSSTPSVRKQHPHLGS